MIAINSKAECASVSLVFLCFLLPLLLLSFWFALDIYRVVLERRVLQNRLDSAGLLAVSHGSDREIGNILRESIREVAPKKYRLSISKKNAVIHSELEFQTSIPFLSLLKAYGDNANDGSLLQRIESTIARKKPRYYLGIMRNVSAQGDTCFQASKAAALRFYSLLLEGEKRKITFLFYPFEQAPTVSHEMRIGVDREQFEVCRNRSLHEKASGKYGVQDIIPESLLQNLEQKSQELWPPQALLWTLPYQVDEDSSDLSQFMNDLKQNLTDISVSTERLVTAVFFAGKLSEVDRQNVLTELEALSNYCMKHKIKISVFILTTEEKGSVYSKRFYQSPYSQAVEIALGDRFNERLTYTSIVNHHETPYVQK